MAILDPGYIEQLRNRRYDPELGTYDLSESFRGTTLSAGTKYIYESMLPINNRYRDITIRAIDMVSNRLLGGQWRAVGGTPDIRLQGSVASFTEIEAASDADLLILQNTFQYCDNYTPTIPWAGNPVTTMSAWKTEIAEELNKFYNDVNEKDKCILVNMQNPKRKIDVVPATWFVKNSYQRELNKGVTIYNNGIRHNDSFPFRIIDRIQSDANSKGESNRRAMRYIKSIKADSSGTIKLTSFEIYTFVTSLVPEMTYGSNGLPLSIFLERQIQVYLQGAKDCEYLISPCGTEYPFAGRRSYFIENFSQVSAAMRELHSNLTLDLYYHPDILSRGVPYS